MGLIPFYLHLFAWAGHISVTNYREMSNYSDLDIGIIKLKKVFIESFVYMFFPKFLAINISYFSKEENKITYSLIYIHLTKLPFYALFFPLFSLFLSSVI